MHYKKKNSKKLTVAECMADVNIEIILHSNNTKILWIIYKKKKKLKWNNQKLKCSVLFEKNYS